MESLLLSFPVSRASYLPSSLVPLVSVPQQSLSSSLVHSRSRFSRDFCIRCGVCSEQAMEPGPSLYPLHRCKIVHLVRHAQGYHNLFGEADPVAYESYEHMDASLTPRGWQQVAELRKHVAKTGLANDIELVVVSPMTRTLQTAVGVFGGKNLTDGEVSSPLMVNGVGRYPRPAISSSKCPPFLAVELCREHIGVHPCDKRNPISKYKMQFPAIDFSGVTTDEDTLWTADVRESDEDLCNRGRTFLQWLLNRKEKQIAVVSHSGFLFHMVSLFGEDCAPTVQKEIRSPFENCALRTIVVADRSGTSKTAVSGDFPGGIPSGPSAGSDLKDEIGNELEDAVQNGSV